MTPVVKECLPMHTLAQAMYVAGEYALKGVKVKVFKQDGKSWVV